MLKPSAIVGSAFLLLSLSTVIDACPAQGGVTWQQLNPVTAPPARWAHAIAYDAGQQRVVLFGGLRSSTNSLSDTWEWDGTDWRQAAPAQSPSARSYHAMAYDSARQRVVLFGGSVGGLAAQDTWEWNGVNWTDVTPTYSPPARSQSTMVYDEARQRVVLFGGSGLNSNPLSDTWEWDGTNWRDVTPAHIPPTRQSHAMAFDASRQRAVVFGGWHSSGNWLSDTWEWDGFVWIQAAPTHSPPARSAHAMGYDSARRRVVFFGGGSPQDTWEWDGVNWTQATPAQSPPARWVHAMAYDAARQRIVLFGGQDLNGNVLSDTWECVSLSPTSFATLGTGCPGSQGVPTLDAAPFSSPWTGDSFSIELTTLPPTAMTFMVTGLSNTFWTSALLHLPAPMMSWGMPGCTVYTDVLASELLTNSGGTAAWTKTIPNDANLIGITFYNQGFVIDPGVNAMGATVSNAGAATIGMR